MTAPQSSSRGSQETRGFDAWFDGNFLDPDGGSAHLPDWFRGDMQRAWSAALECGAELNRHSGAVEMEKRAEHHNPGGGHEVTGQDLEKPYEQKADGMIPRPSAGSFDVAQGGQDPSAWLYEMAFYIKPSDDNPFRDWKQVVTIAPPPTIPKDGVRNIVALYASPPAVLPAGTWRPIETAAKDGTPMLFCNYDDPEQDVLPIVSGFWSRLSEGWYAELSGQKIRPTHWMPLLAPPTLVVPSTDHEGGK